MTATPWDIEGKWSVSRHGYSDEIRSIMPYAPKKVLIRDITFREGDDCIGLRISVPEKLKMLEYAVTKLGIEEVDNGGPSLHQHQFNFARAIKDSGLPVRGTARFFALTKDYKRDVDIGLEAGSTDFRVVSMQLNDEIFNEQLDKLPEIVEYIHKCGTTVGIALSDSTRAPLPVFDKYFDAALAAGADNLNMPDTFGVASPPVMKFLCERLRKKMPKEMDLVIHMHNTFGLATANSVACVEGGATQVDGAINGYGDEAGNASMEEIALTLEALYGIDTGLHLQAFAGYSQMAEEFGKVRCQPHKAIIGENAFLRPMVVWHGHDMARESWMMHEALYPECVGMPSHVVFGPEASLDPEPIELKFKELGIKNHTADDIVKVRKAVEAALQEERIIRTPTPYLTEAQFDDLVKKLFNA